MTSTGPDEPGARRGPPAWVLAAVLVAVVFTAYRGSLSADFAWLDHREIVEGALVIDDPRELAGLLLDDRNYAGYHRPLYDLAHSLDRALWGLDPFGFHLSSLVLHALCVLLALALTLRLGLTRGEAFGVALLFALHPVDTAVAGLIHAKADLLVTAFLLAAAWLSLAGTRRSALASLGCFLLAALSKETAFVYPLLVAAAPALGVWPRSASGAARARSGFRAYLAALAGLAAVLVLARLALGSAAPASGPGLLERLATFLGVYVGYVRTLVLPLDLSVCDTVTRFSALTRGAQVFTLVAFGALVVLQVALWRRRPGLRKWIALFDLALLPVSQLVPILHFRADRFLYLPSLAFAGLLVEGLSGELRALAASRRWRPAAVRALGAGLLLATALAYGLLVARRVPILHDDASLFGYEVRRTPDYREGLAVLARHHQRNGDHAAALPLLERALVETPGRLSYLDVDGTVLACVHGLLALGRPAEARALALEHLPAVTQASHREELEYDLAVAARHLGDHRAAIEGFQRYRARHPHDPGCLYLLGTSALAVGERALAREALSAYLALGPELPDRALVQRLLEEAGRGP